jgi:pilus assembly protein FimV
MPRLSLHFAFGTAILLISPVAMALGFGPSRTQTTLGQPLNFAASVLLDVDENVSRDCISAEVFAGDNVVAPRHVRAALEATRDPNRRIVRVTTAIAIDEPVVTIEVSIGCGSRISRRFVAFIDPPSLHLAEADTPSEAVPLPSRTISSQTALLADIARQADASRRGGSAPVASDGERQARSTRRPARAPAAPVAVVVASETPPVPRARRQAAAARPASPRTRTALAAPPRAAGARLRLDPPSALAALRTPLSPNPPIAPTSAIEILPAIAASAPLALALAAPPSPLLAQVAAVAAAAAGASQPGVSAEQERIRSLEAAVARMNSESQATQQTVAALQARVRQAEDARYRNVLVYILVATTLLGILAATALWWLRPRQRRRARWFDAQASQQARVARAGPSTAAGLASQPAPLSRPAPFSPPSSAAPRPTPSRIEPPTGWGTASGGGTSTQTSIGGLEVTTVLGPELSRPTLEPFVGGASARRGELTMEELIDLEQQAEFFVVLGQDEAAMTLLDAYIDGSGGMSPLPYLQLLEIHQRRGEQAQYDRVRQSFNERFNANAPDWSSDLHLGRTLDDYPQTVAMLQSLWTTPLSAMQALDNLLFRRQDAEHTFDFPAYRELLFLYSIAREISGNVETDSGSIDLFLPLEDVVAAHSQYGALEVDLDVSQWPEDAAMSDLLSRPRPAGRRGAA